MSQSNVSNAAFQKALQQHLDYLKLDANQQSSFGECSPDAILDEIQRQSNAYIRNHRMIRYLSRFEQIISPLEQFFSVLDQSVSSQFAFSGAVWGCLRFVVAVVTSFASYFERIVDVLENITQNLRFYQDYATELYKASDHVQQALADVYAAILMVCREVKHTFRTKQNQDRSSAAILMRTLNPWNRTLDTLVQDLNKRQQLLKQETKHADRIFDHQDRKAQMEREQADSARYFDEARDRFLKDVPYAECYSKHGQSQEVLSADLDAGRWLLERIEYKEWKSHAGGGLLRLNGKPGAGKTILTSIVIEDLEQQRRSIGKIGVGFFYCQHNDASKRDALNLLGTLVHHLLRQLTVDAPLIQTLRGYSHTQIKTVRGLQELLTVISAQFERVYIAVDALDECDPQSIASVLQALLRLSQVVSVVVTSRDKSEIRQAFASGTVIAIDPLNIAEDIRQFVERKVYLKSEQTDVGLPGGEMGLLIKDPTLRHEIVDALLAGADGMFLWVDLQIAHLQQQSSDHEIRQALKSLPQGLEATFIRSLRVIEDLPSSRRARARRALRWIVFAQRPLSLTELVEAVAIDDMDGAWDATRIVNEPMVLINDCTYLVSHTTYPASARWPGSKPYDNVQLIHASVKDFLLGSSDLFTSDLLYYHFTPLNSIHVELVASCFAYLRLVVADHVWDPPRDEKHPFLKYIGYSCFRHIQSSESLAEGFFAQFSELAASSEIKRVLTAQVTNASQNRVWMDTHDEKFSILHMAALLNLPVFVNIILRQHSIDISQSDSEGRIPLHCAASSGSAENTTLLLDAGSDVNAVDNREQTPLHYAAGAWNGEKCIQLLLEKGANVNAKDSQGSTPFHYAAEWGEGQRIEILLQYGADPTVVDNWKMNVLHKVARSGFVDADQRIRILLEHSFDLEGAIKAADEEGCTPLHIAAQHAQVGFLRFCLDHGGDAYARTNSGQTLLHKAAEAFHFYGPASGECVCILLDKLEVDCRDNYGQTPLFFAMRNGSIHIIDLLLKHGAKLDVVNNNGQTILHMSAGAWGPSIEPLKVVLERSAMEDYHLDVNVKDHNGNTPLHEASRRGILDRIRLLLQYGVDMNVLNHKMETVLHSVADRQQDAVNCLEFFISKGFEVDCVDAFGRTPLHCAAAGGCRSNIEFLLHRGANPHHVDNAGTTALHNACRSLNPNAVDCVTILFSEHSMDVNIKAQSGRTPLHYASTVPVVQLLIDHGADPNARDNHGKTPLHCILSSDGEWRTRINLTTHPSVKSFAFSHIVDIFAALVAKGADVNALDNGGKTPFDTDDSEDSKDLVDMIKNELEGTDDSCI